MAFQRPLPSDHDAGENELVGDDRLPHATEPDLGEVSETEDVDEADAAKRLEQEPEEQKNATDPGYEAGEDAPG